MAENQWVTWFFQQVYGKNGFFLGAATEFEESRRRGVVEVLASGGVATMEGWKFTVSKWDPPILRQMYGKFEGFPWKMVHSLGWCHFFDSGIFAKKHKKVNGENSMGIKNEKGSKMD